MRPILPASDLFVSPALPHEYARELAAIDDILSSNPMVARLVWKDLQQDAQPNRRHLGRPGLPADVVLRATIIKQMHGFSYEHLAFHLADSRTYLRFCGFTHPLEVPGRAALAQNIKRISGETWEQIHQRLVGYAHTKGVEDGHKLRIDPTVSETNIHHPTDNALLFDCVKTLARLLARAHESFAVPFHNRTRRAKKCHMAIVNARTQAHRLKPYRELLNVTREMIRDARHALAPLRQETGLVAGLAHRLADRLAHYLPLAERVVAQTQRRVFHGEAVPADEKLVSIFEPHTDIIRKDGRATYYGHKVTLTGGTSGLVLDWVIETGNPADVTLFTRMLDRHHQHYGAYPRQVAADGALASKDNLKDARERGVHDIVFAKKRGLSVEDMASSPWVYRQLRNFRAGIEGVISFLKRVFGLRRCPWKGACSFASYVGASIVSANLLLLARHLIS